MQTQEPWHNYSQALAQAIPENALHPKALGYIRASPAKRYALACSGGVDSLCLLLWARGSPLFLDKTLVVLHYNHKLRGEQADADEAFVQEVAKALGCPCRSAQHTPGGRVSEGALREARLAFFHATLKAEGIEALLLGHQKEDVAETLLMRLGRGAGTRGLAAPRPVQKMGEAYRHLRPFLSLSKAFIKKVMGDQGIPWQEDASNAEGLYLRNRIRKSVLPALQEAFKDREVANGFALSRTVLEEEDDALEAWLSAVLKDQSLEKGLARACLEGLPRALWRRALHVFLRFHGLQDRLSASGFERLLNGFCDHTLRPFSIGDKTLFLKKNKNNKESVLFCVKTQNNPLPSFLAPIALQEGQVIDFSNATKLVVEPFPGSYEERLSCIKAAKDKLYQAFIAANTPLYYRFWQVGDRYRPLNAPGSKKLQDLFVDKKVPRALRSQLPVVLDAELQPIWAPGLTVADSHKISPSTQYALRLTYTKNF